MKICITGSISSGKTTATKIISNNKGPIFSADRVVKNLYLKKKFKNIVAKKMGLKTKSNFKTSLKKKLLEKKENLRRLEKTVHPFVRKEMFRFIKRNKSKKFLFFEIPLLVESKLVKYFDLTVFIKADRNTRLKRYLKSGGNIKIFNFLDKNQLKDVYKMKFCDHVVVNNMSQNVLKKKLLNIIAML
tara:strand:+ start:117 stop:677 length:561 start_codon:yes stop_codon:yes gene_type:complete